MTQYGLSTEINILYRYYEFVIFVQQIWIGDVPDHL